MAIQPVRPDAEGSRPPLYALAHTLAAHTRSVTAVRFSSDGRLLVSAGADGYLHFWDASSFEHVRALRAHRTGINDLALSPDSLYFATASDDCTSTIHLLHPSSTTTPLRLLEAHTAPVLAVAFSPKSNLLVTGSHDESAIIWDVRRGTVLRQLPAHSEGVWTVGWDGEGGMVLTGSADGLIRLWDANTGQCLKTLDNDTNSPVAYASILPSPFFLLSATLSSTIRIYNIHTSRVVRTLRAPGTFLSESKPCPAILFPAVAATTPGKKEAWVVSGSENGKVVLWQVGSRRVAQVLEDAGQAGAAVLAVAVSADGRCMASGAAEPDGRIRIWVDEF